MQISEWASTVGRENTEREFGEAAAYVLPADADAALFAGRAAKRSGDYRRAEQWYRRAFGIARRAGDKEAQVLALIRRGALAEERGNTIRALKLHWRAWRGGRRFKLDKLSAYARHELLVIAIYAGTFEEANEHAATALQLYGRFDERFPQLAHDTAFLWAHYGYFSLALPIYEAVLPYIVRPSERIQVIANIGRAGAACRDVDRFYWAWGECERGFADAGEHSATALLNLAHGARALGFRTKAHELARRGLEIARGRGAKVIEAHLNTFLEGLSTASSTDTNHEPSSAMVDLTAQLTARLRRGPPS
jgi:tetratricopeptide (TPR) repeat protein